MKLSCIALALASLAALLPASAAARPKRLRH